MILNETQVRYTICTIIIFNILNFLYLLNNFIKIRFREFIYLFPIEKFKKCKKYQGDKIIYESISIYDNRTIIVCFQTFKNKKNYKINVKY